MELELLEWVLDTLFPHDLGQAPAVDYDPTEGDKPAPVTPAEMSVAMKKMSAKNTAPGPDGVAGKAMSLALTVLGENLAEMVNKCICDGTVPRCWKTSKLVLLPKPGKNPNSPVGVQTDMPIK